MPSLENANALINHYSQGVRDFTGLTLINAQLQGENLQGISARDINFHSACLKNAVLINADLTNASFIRSDLTAANLQNSNCKGADFSETNLLATNLEGCDLENSIIYNADFSKAINVPDKLSSYLERYSSLAIREKYSFSTALKEERQACIEQYGEEASQYADYAIWLNQIPLLPSYKVPQSLLRTLFRLSPRIKGSQGISISHFFFNIYYKPASLLAKNEPTNQEKEELILLGEQVFELVRDLSLLDDYVWRLENDYETAVHRPVLHKSSEEFAQWLIQASRLKASKGLAESSGQSSQKIADITAAATELAKLAGEEFVICSLNDGDYNSNQQYSAYAVISRHYLMFILKRWEL